MDHGYVSLLRTLRDIEGVLGSFLVGDNGQLLARDIAAACDSAVLRTVGARVEQLCDAFVSAHIGGSFESTTLTFAEHKLQVRALGSAFLIAVVTAHANMPALKMAMNMVGRRIAADFARSSWLPDAPARASEPPAHGAAAASEGPTRSYRGRRFGGSVKVSEGADE
jgi:predicted regulator of Ras-like GTPase activity (Roadblock/LC7/MglB family)